MRCSLQSLADIKVDDQSGIRTIIDSAIVSYERLPMLEIVFDRLVRLMTTRLRNFTSDNVEVSIDRITSVRFGDYLNSIPLPAILAVFKAEEWDNSGLLTVDSNLIYSIIDVLLGGRRGPPRSASRAGPTRRSSPTWSSAWSRWCWPTRSSRSGRCRRSSSASTGWRPIRASPRSRGRPMRHPVRLRIDMEDRGGTVEFLIPYATLEPIRDVLLQMFMGEKFGRDSIWENHLATEIGRRIDVDAVLYEEDVPLRAILDLKVGDTLPIEVKPDALVMVRCGEMTSPRAAWAGSATGSPCASPSIYANRAPPSPCSKWRAAPETPWRHNSEQRHWHNDRGLGRDFAHARRWATACCSIGASSC